MTDPRVDEPAGTSEASGPGGLVRLRLDVAYDGTDFHGWARQPALRSVQAELEAALRAVLRWPDLRLGERLLMLGWMAGVLLLPRALAGRLARQHRRLSGRETPTC